MPSKHKAKGRHFSRNVGKKTASQKVEDYKDPSSGKKSRSNSSFGSNLSISDHLLTTFMNRKMKWERQD